MKVPSGTKEIFCRPMRDLVKAWGNQPSAKALGYFQGKRTASANPAGIESLQDESGGCNRGRLPQRERLPP
jgi:hypothetical protein